MPALYIINADWQVIGQNFLWSLGPEKLMFISSCRLPASIPTVSPAKNRRTCSSTRTIPWDWFAWNGEAFARARQEGKPIFLSIGYSACHWCHVMERESFENEKTGAYLNK